MKRKSILAFALILSCLSLSNNDLHAQQFPFQDTSLPVEQRVDDLLSRLTLDEKIAFLEHQNPAVERLGIKPYSWWNEALHGIARNGVATVYPMPIALAATFNPQMVEEVYSRIADEGVRKHRQSQEAGEYGDNTGITFFTPNINIFRAPRWGRGMETFGEDPYLTAQMGLAAVRGLQGPGAHMRFKAGPTWVWPDTAALHSPYLVSAACLKHLAVHSGPEGLRHQFDARISNRDLWTTYLPAFEYIIKHSDVQQVMCGYNRLNGEPCCTNHHLLVDILRNRWQYDGILVTDCWALNDCWEPDTVIPRHRTHATAAQAAAAAFGSEVDLECGSGLAALRTAVDSGYISEAKIDEHLRRILRTRFRIRPEWFSEYNHGNKSLYSDPARVASNTLVLLKNNGILPLNDPKRMEQIAVIGPNAADSAMALGNYNGEPPYQKTIHKAFVEDIRHDMFCSSTYGAKFASVYFDTACHLADNGYKPGREFWKQIAKSDVVVFCGGLSPALEGEELQVNMPGFYKGDRTSIELPAPQRDLIKEIKRRTGKPIVLVLCTGSAIGLEEVVDDVDAIVVAWYGGQDMGTAVVNALFGNTYSFGRLPVTFYRSTEQLPAFDDYDMSQRTYRYMEAEPLFPFGYGLSYGHFHYDSISFDRESLTIQGVLVLDSVDDFMYEQSEVIQIYLEGDGITAPRRQLVAVQHAHLDLRAPVRSRTRFAIDIDPFWLRRYNENTDTMELPPAGTPMTLKIMNGPSITFTW
ncbi:MAG: glycoside hydrolase family 3 C-terminal domain-containing protein [Bacteroidales bacterium]|nr:glycoside hydrolase family 3 C-terminal domain-containing protein [Bacteroidales bacterium]